jgi:phospholipid/cholesterol/gamma-HCH transport system substrate-binding protein
MIQQHSYQKRDLLTGFFLAFGLIALIGSLWISGQHIPFFKSHLILHTELSQGQGLNSGSLVALNGITVGNIRKIEISSEDIRKIRVTLEIKGDFHKKIPQDSYIEMKTQGALGDRYLQITPGKEEKTLESHGFIESKNSQDLIDFMGDKASEAQKLFFLLDESLSLLKSLNQKEKIHQILTQSEESLLEFKYLIKDLRQTLKTFQNQEQKTMQSSLIKLDSLLEDIHTGQGTLGLLIRDPSVYRQIKSLLDSPSSTQRLQHMESLYQKNLQFQKIKSSP